jgi:hypothetical protein
VIYKVQYQTNFGWIVFVWRGQEYVEIFRGDDPVPEMVNPFNYEIGMLPFRKDLQSFSDYCRWYLWEMERGVEILSVKEEQISIL